MAEKKARDAPKVIPIPGKSIRDFEPVPEAVLKKQSRDDDKPWQPGETPTRGGSLITVNQPLDAKPNPGEFYGVEKPTNRGKKHKVLMHVVDSPPEFTMKGARVSKP